MISNLTKYLFFVLLSIPVSCHSANPGCTDPKALNYDSLARVEDGSCKCQGAYVSPEWSKELGEQIPETSGLIYWDGVLWTMNDDTDTRLYLLDAESAEIVGGHTLQGVINQDWEEIAQDEEYVYVGDFGNNMGMRKNLHILRIEKRSLKSGNPSIDTIWFSYSDQQDFASTGFNQTEFDCEAFIVASDGIYLFTKQWLSSNTTLYELPKLPGTYVAQKIEVYPIQGQVTGASFLEEERVLVLCGYAGLVQPFLYLFYDYQDFAFFSGNQKRLNISLPFHQVEGVATTDGLHYYISNEHFTMESYVDIPQRLHMIDLDDFLGEYLKSR